MFCPFFFFFFGWLVKYLRTCILWIQTLAISPNLLHLYWLCLEDLRSLNYLCLCVVQYEFFFFLPDCEFIAFNKVSPTPELSMESLSFSLRVTVSSFKFKSIIYLKVTFSYFQILVNYRWGVNCASTVCSVSHLSYCIERPTLSNRSAAFLAKYYFQAL